MQANTGKVCAQLTNEQLQNGFTYTEETYNNTAWLKYAASILFIGGITNAFSQTAVWEFKTTKTELQDKTTSKSISKDSIYIQGSIINAVTNKPLTYPMLVEIQSENKTLTQTISSDTGSFNLLISNKENVDKINVILHYQNIQNDTIQVPKEQVSFEKSSIENIYNLVIRTAINSESLKICKRNKLNGRTLGDIQFIPETTKKLTLSENEFVIVDGVKIRRDKLPNEDIPYNSSNGTPANIESKPLDNNNQNR